MGSEFEEGTREVELEAIRQWQKERIEQQGRGVLGIIGPVGVGKSVLLAHVCQNAQDEGLAKVGAAHFFKYDDPKEASVRHCLFSLAEQLAWEIPEVKDMVGNEHLEDIEEIKPLFRAVLACPLQKVAHREAMVVVLDALDEAKERNALLEIVTELWEKEMPVWLALLVSCRPVCNLRGIRVQVMRYDSEANYKDIALFVRNNLELSEAQELEEAVRLVASKCAGSFVCARELVHTLRNSEPLTLLDICDVVADGDDCGNDDTAYRAYFSRLLHNAFHGDHDLYHILLSSLAVCRFALHRNMIRLILGRMDVDQVLQQASELLLVNQDGSVSLPHETMARFLLSRRRAGKELYVSEKVGHKALVAIFLQDRTSPLALEHLIYHLCQLKDWDKVEELVLDFDWLHSLVSLQGVAQQVIEDLDEFYNYRSFSDSQVTDVVRAVNLGLGALEQNPDLLMFEFFGRIQDRDHPALKSSRASQFAQRTETTQNVFLPTVACLSSATSGLGKVLGHHHGYVSGVAIAGNNVASGSSNGLVRVWNWRTGERLHELGGHSRRVNSVAIEGDVIVSGSWDETVRVWDARTGACLRLLQGHTDCVNSVAVSGNVAVSGSHDTTVRLWNWRTGECLHILRDHAEHVNAVAMHKETVVSGSDDQTVRIWCVKSGNSVHVLRGHTSWVQSVALDCDTVVSGSSDKTVLVWDKRNGACLHVLQGHFREVRSVALDGNIILSESWDAMVCIWDLYTGECLRTLQGHFAVYGIAIQDGIVVSGWEDGTMRVWQVSKHQKDQQLRQPGTPSPLNVAKRKSSINTVALNHSSVLSGTRDGSIRLHPTIDSHGATFSQASVFEGPTNIQVLRIGQDSNNVVAAFENGLVRVWDARSKTLLSEFMLWEPQFKVKKADAPKKHLLKMLYRRVGGVIRKKKSQGGGLHSKGITCVAFGCEAGVDGILVSGSRDETVRVWDLGKCMCICVLEGHTNQVNGVAIHDDAVVSRSLDGTVRIWDWHSKSCLKILLVRCVWDDSWAHQEMIGSVALSDTLVADFWDGILTIWNRQTGIRLCHERHHARRVGSVALFGNTVWTCCWDKTVRRWTVSAAGQVSTSVVAVFESSVLSLAVKSVGDILIMSVAVEGKEEPILLKQGISFF